MTPARAPRFRVTVHQLHEGKTTKVIDAYGSGFITAVATINGDTMEIHFGEAGRATSNNTSPTRSPTSTAPAPGANSIRSGFIGSGIGA